MKQHNITHRWLSPLVFLINIIIFYVTAQPLLGDSDVPWHLATGKLLLATHHLPATDPWSFTAQGAPWYNLSWAWDALLGAVEHVAGAFGVLIFVLSLCAALPAALAARLLSLRIAPPAVFFTVMLASLCLLDFITARPHLAGYVLALAFHAILHRSRNDARYGRLLWLPPLMIVWANMHGSFIAGFTIIGAYVIEAFFTRRHDWLRRLIIITLACAIAALINPYGPDIFFGALRTLGGHAKTYTIEWLPYAFTISAGVSAWLMIFILASNVRGANAFIADKILAVGWLIATMFVMRNGALFILLSAPYLATCLDEQTRGLRQMRPPSPVAAFLNRQSLHHLWLACAAAFALCIAVANALPHADKILPQEESVGDAVDFSLQHYPSRRFLTDFNFSGQIVYFTDGKLPVFIDSRAGTAYPEQIILDYLDFLWQRPGWQDKMTAYGVNAILIGNQSNFAQSYGQGRNQDAWQLVFAGKRANVYIARPLNHLQ